MLTFNVATVAVSGSDVEVVKTNLNAQGPVRLFLTNSGGQALSACKVQLGPTVDGPWVDHDTTTFGSLGSGVTKSLVIQEPVAGLQVLASKGAGDTTVDAACVGSAD